MSNVVNKHDEDILELIIQWIKTDEEEIRLNTGTKTHPLKSNSVKGTLKFLDWIGYEIVGQRYYTNSSMKTKLDILKVKHIDTGTYDTFYIEYDKEFMM